MKPKSKVTLPMPVDGTVYFDAETSLVPVSASSVDQSTVDKSVDLKNIFSFKGKIPLYSKEYLLNRYSVYDSFTTIAIKGEFERLNYSIDQQQLFFKELFNYLFVNNLVSVYDGFLEFHKCHKFIHIHALTKHASAHQYQQFKKYIRKFMEMKKINPSSKSIVSYKISTKKNASIEYGINYVIKDYEFNKKIYKNNSMVISSK